MTWQRHCRVVLSEAGDWCICFKPRLHIRVMREAWCVKRDACSPKSLKIGRATPHARHAWCVFVLGSRIHLSGSGQHASREPIPWRHFLDSPGYPPRSLHVIQRQPRADPFVDYIVFFFICATFWWQLHCYMQLNVIDDTYLEKLVNLVEEHPALYDTSLNEYIKTTSELETFGTI